MGRAPCCDKANVKKGPWSPEEDAKLKEYIEKNGTGGNWIALPQKAGLKRCGKSCRLRWLNYLRPNIKHGDFTDDEDRIICTLYSNIGSRWSIIAAQLPGRTDNDIKNYWNTKLKKKLMGMMMIQNPNYAQRKLSHQLLANSFSSLVQANSSLPSSPSTAISTSTSSSSSSPLYNINTLARSLTEPIPFSSPLSSNNSFAAATVLQPQERIMGSIQNYQVMFGGEASCSSSDGSCSNQISHGQDHLDHEYGGGASTTEQMGFQGYYYNGVEESQKLMGGGGGCGGGGSGCGWGDNLIDYGLEEIKQLISTTTSSSYNFLFEESKAEERVMMYY